MSKANECDDEVAKLLREYCERDPPNHILLSVGAGDVRATGRLKGGAGDRGNDVGFRVARTLE